MACCLLVTYYLALSFDVVIKQAALAQISVFATFATKNATTFISEVTKILELCNLIH